MLDSDDEDNSTNGNIIAIGPAVIQEPESVEEEVLNVHDVKMRRYDWDNSLSIDFGPSFKTSQMGIDSSEVGSEMETYYKIKKDSLSPLSDRKSDTIIGEFSQISMQPLINNEYVKTAIQEMKREE